MSWPPVRTSCLHQRMLNFLGGFGEAILFPFFDGDGVVQKVLVIDSITADLRTFLPFVNKLTIPVWGPMQAHGPLK